MKLEWYQPVGENELRKIDPPNLIEGNGPFVVRPVAGQGCWMDAVTVHITNEQLWEGRRVID